MIKLLFAFAARTLRIMLQGLLLHMDFFLQIQRYVLYSKFIYNVNHFKK